MATTPAGVVDTSAPFHRISRSRQGDKIPMPYHKVAKLSI